MVLFTDPVKIGDIECSNRTALAPLTRARATEDNIPTDLMREYYIQRHSTGLIISEGTNISPQAVGWHMSPGIWNDKQVEAWKPILKAIHDKGGKIVCQLWHTGRRAHSSLSHEQIVSASAISTGGWVHGEWGVRVDAETPAALTKDQIAQVVKDYGNAAKNALAAGFDGVEIHGANGYLVDQFIQECSNVRDDEYGGSVENRMRFLEEVVDSVLEHCPAGRTGIRFSPHGSSGSMGTGKNVHQTFEEAIKLCAKKNLAFIHLMDGVFLGRSPDVEQWSLKEARELINSVGSKTCLIGNTAYTKDLMVERLAEGDAEMIAFGRPFITNPDLFERYRDDAELNPDIDSKFWFFPVKGAPAEGYTTFRRMSEAALKPGSTPTQTVSPMFERKNSRV